MNPDTPLPYQRPCASRSTSIRRCTRTGTSWPRSPAAASSIELPYETQFTWAIDRLQPEQLKICVEETHRRRERARRRAVSGRGRDDLELARDTATSSRSRATAPIDAHPHTEQWLHDIGLPFDELYCSYDKIARCVELEIDVLIDDSPINLERALEVGMTAATLEHPWNRELDGVITRRATLGTLDACWRELLKRPRLGPRRDGGGRP